MNKILVVLAVAALLIVAFSGCIQSGTPTDGGVESPDQVSSAMVGMSNDIDGLIGSLDQLDQDIGK